MRFRRRPRVAPRPLTTDEQIMRRLLRATTFAESAGHRLAEIHAVANQLGQYAAVHNTVAPRALLERIKELSDV